MKNKVLYFCFGISLIVIIVLGVYIIKYEQVCIRKHLDEIPRAWDVVPDEETAKKIADIIIDTHSAFNEDWVYNVEVELNEQSNEWEVCYYGKVPEDKHVLSEIIVYIKKDSGWVTGLDFNP